ncbi:putative phosphoglycerate mutase [Curtobacterium sp. PhB172]|uniref:histidine phosphatase family protein n=1 Tax=unclassified Curtobacterium TaxID=257496 RepID=UPI000F46C214|nr:MULTISPECIES: histidine phosphatase family protein [unclassified Curtobacterium]ROQ07602.1 putative phosphoglycerate mutase [Curtobacterium sp. PhB171]ROQ23787.1 putative phosphoglycerate mutase [Curtobacterium sp. PhB170]ROS35701.1 putative phosphoglycerate mutase [Curtobacterium sp. PhB131]ROS67222.1 putative phosphoglycerate mutase [Curtobacterium sp. PhB172]ROS69810.1 putative phosphoglycerate mutase [Curtobacterium sp. PhB141]
MTTLLYLVRHGETDWNAQRRIQGSTDIPLNDTGRRQAAEAAELLARRQFDAVVASPLSRAAETGAIIADRLGLAAPVTYAGLAERSYGEAEGLTDTEVTAKYPHDDIPGRESRSALLARITETLGEIAVRFDGGVVVVATHGAVIRSVVNEAAPGTADRHATPIRNGSIHSFRWDPERFHAELVRFDDPIDDVSDGPGRYAFDYQNPLERRG